MKGKEGEVADAMVERETVDRSELERLAGAKEPAAAGIAGRQLESPALT